MDKLNDNQILITRSEDGKTTFVRMGSFDSIAFSSCPDKPYENIQNSINAYFEVLDKRGLRPKEWERKGCYYKDNGSCMDCN